MKAQSLPTPPLPGQDYMNFMRLCICVHAKYNRMDMDCQIVWTACQSQSGPEPRATGHKKSEGVELCILSAGELVHPQETQAESH